MSPFPAIRRGMPRAATLFAGCLMLLVFAPVASALPTLNPGDEGKSVKSLQRALGVTADGIYGPGTERLVKRFQRRHDLPADAIVGAATWRMLRRAGHTAGAKASPRSKRSVALLQRRLGIAADGVFGPGTQRAVKRYQRSRGLTADGVVGDATWSSLGINGRRPVLKRVGLGRRGADSVARRPADRRGTRDQRRQPHRASALQVRRRARLVPGQRL